MKKFFIKTFKVDDGCVFAYSNALIREFLPDGVAIVGGAEPVFNFHPEGVTVAIEVFERRNR